MNEWLTTELENALAQWQRAGDDLIALSGRAFCDPAELALSKYQRDYWAGYADALTNALNQFAGPGDN